MLDSEGLRVTPAAVEGLEIEACGMLLLDGHCKSCPSPEVTDLLSACPKLSFFRALKGPGAIVFILFKTFPPPFSLGLRGAYTSDRSDSALLPCRSEEG